MKNKPVYRRYLWSSLVFVFSSMMLLQVTAQVTYFVDDDTGDDSRTPLEAQNPLTPWLTIQHAINSAANSDTIVVAPGTYQEQISLQKSLTLRGATYQINKNGYPVPPNYAWDDNVESIIDCAPAVQTLFTIKDVNDATLEGFILQALYRDNNSQNHLLHIFAYTQNMDNIVIRNNIIGPNTHITLQDGTMGRMNVWIDLNDYDYGLTNSLITGNKVFDSKGNGNNIFIFGSYELYSYSISAPMNGTVMSGNELSGSHRSGIEVAGGIDGLSILNNHIFGNTGLPGDPPGDMKYGNGIVMVRGSSDLVSGANAHGPTNTLIEGNRIYGNQKNGIYLGPVDSNLVFRNNSCILNGWDNIRVDMEEHYYDGNVNLTPVYDKLYDIFTRYNNIFDSDSAGARVIGVPTNGFFLQSEYDYWGAEDGPSGVGPGSGDEVSQTIAFTPWVDDEILDYEHITTTSPALLGPAGGSLQTTITSIPGPADLLDGYQTGEFTDIPETDEDFITNNTGCILRFKLLWGLVETGSVSADMFFDYSGQPGITDPSSIIILKRDNALDPSWEYFPETSRDDLARTITIAGVTEYGEFVLGLKGKIWVDGNGNTDWNDPFNWFSFGIPATTDNITIPAGLPLYPETNSGPTAVCNSIYIENGAHVTVPPDNALTVYGDILCEGMINIATDNAGHAGSLITHGFVAGTGTFSFNRDMTGTGAWGGPAGWHLISSPVEGVSCHDFFDYYINVWTESINEWEYFCPGDTPCVAGPNLPLAPMKGFSIKRELNYVCNAINPATGNIVELEGPAAGLHSGTMSHIITGTDFEPGDPNGLNNWNLIGNPYPSPIDYELWFNIMGGIPAGVDNAIYFWDDDALTYRSWVAGVGYTQYIPATQAFFMHVNTAGSYTLSMDNSIRVHNGSNEFFKSDVSDLLTLEVSGRGYSDQTYIRFLDHAQEGFDSRFDAYKLLSEVQEVPQLFTRSGNTRLSINSMPARPSIELHFLAGTAGEYTIRTRESSDFEMVLLEDHETGTLTDLTINPYTFYYKEGEPENRFMIHFMSSGENKLGISGIFSDGTRVFVINTGELETTLTMNNLLGQEVMKTRLQKGLNTIIPGNRSGYFIVQVRNENGMNSEKVYLR
ncbi:MAG: right-handed parallel beta-helix repeat-containing protein [Bacteroidales bacterium]|nr:right-handed parallel beta-helix repeat-containing protein [Bacteroidales bacterium]